MVTPTVAVFIHTHIPIVIMHRPWTCSEARACSKRAYMVLRLWFSWLIQMLSRTTTVASGSPHYRQTKEIMNKGLTRLHT